MTACGHCHRFVGGEADKCQFPNSDLCRSEARKEDEAHVINNSYKRAKHQGRLTMRGLIGTPAKD